MEQIMTEFTVIDVVAAGVVILSALLSYARGFTREVMSILGWVAASIIAFTFASQVQPLIKEVPVIGGFLAESCELSILAAFIVVFALALVLASLFTPLLGSIIQRSFLNAPDQTLGLLFGVARGGLLVVVALIVYDRAFENQDIAMVKNSTSTSLFSGIQERIDASIPTHAPSWVNGKYSDLLGNCTKPVTLAPEVTNPTNL
ncbi:MAG: membrane protein required for colicin V production [Paracoccaceae bacterium]|jgi:membrane protein required for colicin V production